MTPDTLSVLIVDDNPGDLGLVASELAFLDGAQFKTTGVGSLAEGIERAHAGSFDVVILDMGLPDSSGLDTVTRFVAAVPDVPVVVLTGLNDRAVGIAAVRAGAQDYLVKGDVRGDLLERALMHAMERRRIQAQVRESEIRLRAVLEESPVGVAISRPDGSLVFLNRRLAEMHGLSPNDFAARSAVQFYVHPKEREELVAQALSGQPVRDREVAFRRVDGVIYWALVNMLATQHGGETALLTWIYDITARKAAEEALREAKERAEREARARAEFLAMMSHEIRTPMTGVLGMVRLLMSGDLTAEQRDCVETIAYSGEALMTIVDDALDLTRLDAGRMDLDHGTFDPRRLVHSVVHLMSSRAAERGLRLLTDIDPNVPADLGGDAGRVRQVLLNLIGNALKFTERGAVAVAVRPLGDGRSGLKVLVEDSGPGIPDDQIAALFDPYVQGRMPAGLRIGGTGLGLAICRRLVSLMGGEIGVQSTPGRGSVFWFTLPDAGPPPAGGAAVPGPAVDGKGGGDHIGSEALAPGARRLRVLLAEDNPVNQKVVAGFLAHMGHTLTVVGDGQAAVWQAAAGGFDAVLMDINMPILDGLEATAAIRRLPDAAGRVPILALTADVYPEDVERCMAAGMDGHLPKPIEPAQLAAALRRLTAAAAASTPVAVQAPASVLASPLTRPDAVSFERSALEALSSELPAGFLRSLLASFLEEAERDVVALAAPHAVLTDPVLRRRAHDMKATASNFGLRALAAAARDVERAARDGRLADARQAARPLPALLEEAVARLRRDCPDLLSEPGDHRR